MNPLLTSVSQGLTKAMFSAERSVRVVFISLGKEENTRSSRIGENVVHGTQASFLLGGCLPAKHGYSRKLLQRSKETAAHNNDII